MTLKVFGADRLGSVIERCCYLACRLADAVAAAPELELAAPVQLNIVCFRVRDLSDASHEDIAALLQERGEAVLSVTTLGNRRVLRAAIVNHRTMPQDVDVIVPQVLNMARTASIKINV
jgi:glutamate/tyrosine decarboxylase-like PLP-dependent enzyme